MEVDNKVEVEGQLTDEQVEAIVEATNEVLEDSKNLKIIADLPSNNGIEESSDNKETGEMKKVMVNVDPNTGEHKIIGQAVQEDEDEESFEEICDKIESGEYHIEVDNSPISEKELIDYISSSKEEEAGSLLTEMSDELDINTESIKVILDVANRRMKNENFNIYKALPSEVQDMINKYITSEFGLVNNVKMLSQYRNMIAEALISEFITNININRIRTDFNKEIETLFEKGSAELADSVIGYTSERNKKYREYADAMEDEEKKQKIYEILDKIDEAYDLNSLKEFSKKCKIKSIELEKADRVFKDFLRKYQDSQYNIYDINMARPILYRSLSQLYDEKFTDKDINSFFICFCKQCMNMSPEVVTDHAYMYYVIYNIVLTDINKGESKNIGEDFLANIKEVIENIRKRNNF